MHETRELVCFAYWTKVERSVGINDNVLSVHFVRPRWPLLKMLSYEAQWVLATLKNAQNFNKISV